MACIVAAVGKDVALRAPTHLFTEIQTLRNLVPLGQAGERRQGCAGGTKPGAWATAAPYSNCRCPQWTWGRVGSEASDNVTTPDHIMHASLPLAFRGRGNTGRKSLIPQVAS